MILYTTIHDDDDDVKQNSLFSSPAVAVTIASTQQSARVSYQQMIPLLVQTDQLLDLAALIKHLTNTRKKRRSKSRFIP